MSLWDYALTAWKTPGVETAALELQDIGGQSICLLLWAGWTAREGFALDDETIEAACDTARAWDSRVTGPLRSIRRAIKGPVIDISTGDREAIRAQVKTIELDAERRLLASLEALAPADRAAPRPALDALVAVSRVWDRSTPRAGLTALAALLPS